MTSMSKNTSAPPPAAHPVLVRLSRLNRVIVLLATLAFVLVALFSPPVLSGVLLLALAGALIALAASTWPVQNTPTRVLRVIVIGVLIFAALSRLLR
jgi:uncharacterized membrane protein YfcA